MLDYVLQLKGEAQKVKSKIVKSKLKFLPQKESRFDSYVVFKKLASMENSC